MDTVKKRGGWRPGAGRKPENPGEPMKPMSVTLPPMSIRKARVLGGDNLSEGIRKAIEVAYDRYQRSPEVG